MELNIKIVIDKNGNKTTIPSDNNIVIGINELITVYLPSVINEEQYRYLLERKIEFYNLKKDINLISKSPTEIKNLKFNYTQIEELYNEISKNYIPNKDSFILIVPNEKDLVIENGIYFEEFDTNIGHAKMFQVFCMAHMIPIKCPDITGNPWAKELAKNGFLVAKKEKDEIYLFIPKELSINQNNWLDNNKNFLTNFNLLEAGIYMDNGSFKEIFKYYEYPKQKTVTELVTDIYEEIENKKIKKKVI